MPGGELQVTDVTAGYDEAPVVWDVSLRVRPGETLVVVGPNGHGKTTLVRAISGLLALREGEVRLDGERLDGLKAEERTGHGLVHVPQGDGLFPSLTVEENLLMGAFPKAAWARRREALGRVFELFPTLRERRAQQAHTLSGGERRMVALGRGLMREPRVLIVDEPSLGLAPVVIEAVYDTLAQIVRGGTSVLLVEESLAHIGGVADRVCVLEMGRVVRTGPVAEVAADATVAQSYLGVLP